MSHTGLNLELLGGFRLSRGGCTLPVAPGEQRLAAFLAVHRRPMPRGFVAGTLWLESDDDRAGRSLRTALWRLRTLDDRLLDCSRSQLSLSSLVAVDLHEALTHARGLLGQSPCLPQPGERIRLAGDLLPDWHDDWVVIERERFRQLRLHALEALSAAWGAAGAHAPALAAGLECVAADPLRESAHRAVIGVHLAEGNRASAVRQYHVYRELAMAELGLSPSRRIRASIGISSGR